jgi:hypothetical protein
MKSRMCLLELATWTNILTREWTPTICWLQLDRGSCGYGESWFTKSPWSFPSVWTHEFHQENGRVECVPLSLQGASTLGICCGTLSEPSTLLCLTKEKTYWILSMFSCNYVLNTLGIAWENLCDPRHQRGAQSGQSKARLYLIEFGREEHALYKTELKIICI